MGMVTHHLPKPQLSLPSPGLPSPDSHAPQPRGAHSCCPRARCTPGSKAPVHGEAPHSPSGEPAPPHAGLCHLCLCPSSAGTRRQPTAGGQGPGRPPPAAAPSPLPPAPVTGALPGEGRHPAGLQLEGPEPQGQRVGQRADAEVPGAGAPGCRQQSGLLWRPDGGPHRGRHLPGGLCLLLPSQPLASDLQAPRRGDGRTGKRAPGAASPRFRAWGSRSPGVSPQPSPAQPWRSARNTAPEGAPRRFAQLAPPATLEHASAETGLEIFKLHHARLTGQAHIIMN